MIDITINLLNKYNIIFEGRSRIFVDRANPSFIQALKERLDEDTNYEHITSYLKKQYSSVYDLKFLEENMFIVPVAFNKEHKYMLAHCKEMMEYHNGQVDVFFRRSTDGGTSFESALSNLSDNVGSSTRSYPSIEAS